MDLTEVFIYPQFTEIAALKLQKGWDCCTLRFVGFAILLANKKSSPLWLQNISSSAAATSAVSLPVNGSRPTASRTHSPHGELLSAADIEPIPGDVTDVATLHLPAADTVLYAIGLDRSSGKSMREVYLNGLRNVLDVLPTPKRFIYISSTSIYGQSDGGWVDESSPTEPAEENGRIVLECEQLLRERLPSAIILRFAGIYGPGRVIRRAAIIEKGEPIATDPEAG